MENYLDLNKHKIYAIFKNCIYYTDFEQLEIAFVNREKFFGEIKTMLSQLKFSDEQLHNSIVADKLRIIHECRNMSDSLLEYSLYLMKTKEGEYFLDMK